MTLNNPDNGKVRAMKMVGASVEVVGLSNHPGWWLKSYDATLRRFKIISQDGGRINDHLSLDDLDRGVRSGELHVRRS